MSEQSAGSVLLRDDGEWVLSRRLATKELALAPTGRHVSIERMLREHALRAELDAAWAVCPRELGQESGKPVLLLDDPGGQLLSTQSDDHGDIGARLRIACALAGALAGAHARGLIHQDTVAASACVPTRRSARASTSRSARSRDPVERPSRCQSPSARTTTRLQAARRFTSAPQRRAPRSLAR